MENINLTSFSGVIDNAMVSDVSFQLNSVLSLTFDLLCNVILLYIYQLSVIMRLLVRFKFLMISDVFSAVTQAGVRFLTGYGRQTR